MTELILTFSQESISIFHIFEIEKTKRYLLHSQEI